MQLRLSSTRELGVNGDPIRCRHTLVITGYEPALKNQNPGINQTRRRRPATKITYVATHTAILNGSSGKIDGCKVCGYGKRLSNQNVEYNQTRTGRIEL